MTDTTQQPSPLDEEDRRTLSSAAVLASALVSRAESGFFDAVKESFAASRAIRDADPEVQQLLVGGIPELPREAGSDLEGHTLEQLRRAAEILRAKAPQLLEGYRATVLQSVQDVAAAADDTSANEAGTIGRIEQALAG